MAAAKSKTDKRDKLGKFAKGNPGKPEGAISKKTRAWEELGEYIAGEGAGKYMEYLRQLDPEHYMQRFEAVLEYFKPKLARTETKLDAKVQVVPILGGLTKNVPENNSNGQTTETE